MSKKNRNIILIILGFLLSLFLFQLIIGCYLRETFYDSNDDMFVVAFSPIINAGIYHFIFISVMAILVRFTKIDKTYKKILAYLPVYTVVLSLPMSALAVGFANYFHLFGYGG